MIVDLERRWISKSLCRGQGTDLFFADHGDLDRGFKPSKAVRKQWDRAKDFCYDCPVMWECLRDSLGETRGVWGGRDPLELKELRARRNTAVRDLPQGSKERLAHAAMAHRLANTPRLGNREASRIMGLTLSLIATLVSEHNDLLKARKAAEERRARSAAAKVVELPLPDVQWPSEPPQQGDGWVRHVGGVVHAYYLGETEDGEWLFMKAPLSKEDSRSWFKRRDVQLTREVPPHPMTRVGKTSRIYGTTISPNYSADRAG